MGRVKELALQFCEVVYPDDFEKQNRLFEALLGPRDLLIGTTTLERFRKHFEETGRALSLSLEQIQDFTGFPVQKPFPRLCPSCGKMAVLPANIPYEVELLVGKRIHIDSLQVNKCAVCKEILFSNVTDEQISQAIECLRTE